MFCGKCGAECKDGAKFCSKCGAPLKSNALTNSESHSATDSENTPSSGGWFQQHKKIALTILIVIIAIVIVIIAVSVSRHASNDTDMSSEGHLERGVQYLEDGKYEEAVEELTAVLDVEQNMQAYAYLAEAYLDLDETQQAEITYEKAVRVALNEYAKNGAFPENTEEMYEGAVSFDSFYREVARLDELENIIDPSVEITDEEKDSESVVDIEDRDPKEMYMAYYQKVVGYQKSYGTASITGYDNGPYFIDGVALAQLLDLNNDGQDELLLVYNNINEEDEYYSTLNYTLEIWSYDWGSEGNNLKRIHNTWLMSWSDEDYDFEIIETDGKYWFEESGDMVNVAGEDAISEEEWNNTNSEDVIKYPLFSYESDYMDQLNSTISETEEAIDSLSFEANGSGEWQDLYKEYVTGNLELFDSDLGAPVIYELDPESTYQFALIYLNDDDVPELLVYEERNNISKTSEEHNIYTLHDVRDGELKTVGLYTSSSIDFSYIERSSLFYVRQIVLGNTYDDLYYMVKNGTWGDDSETVYSLCYSSENKSYYMDYGVQPTGSSSYNLSTTTLTKKEYNEHKDKLQEYLDDNNAITPTMLSQEEMLEQLQNY